MRMATATTCAAELDDTGGACGCDDHPAERRRDHQGDTERHLTVKHEE
jgi:hypothetical protein